MLSVAEDADFLNIQRDAFHNFIQNKHHIMSEVEKEVYQYYSENVDNIEKC